MIKKEWWHYKEDLIGIISGRAPQRTVQNVLLLQRVLQSLGICKIRRVVRGRGIGTASLRKGGVFHAPPVQQPRQTIVSFEAARLGVNAVLLIALLREFLFEGPRPRPHGRIFDCDLVGEGPWTGAGPALNQVQVLTRSEGIGFRTEVGHVDHERVALPTAARVTEPLTDAGW